MSFPSRDPEVKTATLEWIDTHAHLNDQRLRDRLSEVLGDARAAGVAQVLCIGTTAEDSADALEITREHPGVRAVVGIQPNHVAESKPGDWEQIVSQAADPAVRAIGETGLDRYWKHTPFAQQQDFFDRHLALARERGLPVVIHCRLCEQDIIEQLARQGGPVAGVLHSFTGTWDDAQAFLELGLHISFAGMVTFESKKLDTLRDAAMRVPIDRLLVETDSPYLSPHPFRGKTNMPARVAITGARLAALRGMDIAEFARATTANARRLFRLTEDPILA